MKNSLIHFIVSILEILIVRSYLDISRIWRMNGRCMFLIPKLANGRG